MLITLMRQGVSTSVARGIESDKSAIHPSAGLRGANKGANEERGRRPYHA